MKQAFGKAPQTADEKRARKATANRILAVLKAILNRAFHDELIADDLAWRRVQPFGNVEEPIVRFLTADEAQRLLNACSADFRPLVAGALFTGARYGELVTLAAGDVNLDTEAVFVRPSKSGRGRHVPLSTDGHAFFRSILAGKSADEFAFTKADGAPWRKNHHVRPLVAACEIAKITPAIGFHDLRHTYASALAQQGVDLLSISKLLGHADTRITSRHYAHLCDKTLAAAVMKLPRLKVQSDSKVQRIR
jgi:integrase